MKYVHLRNALSRRNQSGFSLLELALVIVILGITGVLVARWYSTVKSEQAVVAARSAVQRADDALLAFAAVQHRLPCPAHDSGGIEDCSGTAPGTLPWRTLGLPDRRAMSLGYAVMRRPNHTDLQLDVDLAVAKDRTRPMNVIKAGSAVAALPSATGYINGMDFCQALRVSMRSPLDTNHLHTPQGNLAYALSNQSPSMASMSPASTNTDMPKAGSAISPDQTQNILTIGADQLWNRLNCSVAMASVNYSHYNVAATARMQYQTVQDLEEQLKVMAKMGEANVSAATAAVAQAFAGVLGSSNETLQTAGDMLKDLSSFENKSADTPLDITATALAAAATALTGVNTAAAALYLESIKNTRDMANEKYSAIQDKRTGVTELSRLMADCLRATAIAADARGMSPVSPVAEPAISSCTPP